MFNTTVPADQNLSTATRRTALTRAARIALAASLGALT